MIVKYIFHSGFMIENEKSVFIFDYYRRTMPEEVYLTNKDIYFFVSHTHADHFNPEILKYARENVYYIISSDVKKKALHLSTIESTTGLQYEFVDAGSAMTIQGINGSAVYIETLKSTDKGVAYVVTTEGASVYHAGDHNDWRQEELDKSKNNDVMARYRREIDKIKDRKIKVAFLPVDYRLGKYYFEGPLYFMENTDTEYVFPMHMWEKYEYIDKLKNEPLFDSYKDKIVDAFPSGKEWILA